MSEAMTKAEKTENPKVEAKKPPAAAKTKKGPDVADLTRAMLAKSVGLKPLDTAPSTMAHVPSGTIVVDNLIGGSKAQDGKGQVCPGYPRRKITEIYGPESSGKTTLALAAVANVQRAGGTVLYLDFEHALHHGYAKQIGVKFDKSFMLVAPDTMEDGFKAMYVGLLTGVDLIVVDSVAAMVPKAEFEKKIDDAAKVGAVAKKMAETLPKFALWLMKFPAEGTGEAKKPRKDHPGTAIILLNQERASINTGGQSHGGPETNTSGGKALKYFAYVRLRLSRISSETIERKDPLTGKKKKFPYGNLTNVRMIKSKADAKQGHSANIFIRYGFGVDDAYSIIESGIVHGVIVREGAYYSYEGQRIQSRDKFRQYLIANPKVYEEIKNKVIQAILDAAPQVVADEELTDEDAIQAEIEAEFGDDESEAGGEAAEVTLDESEASDAVDDAPSAE
jgi:recombination protein RecA